LRRARGAITRTAAGLAAVFLSLVATVGPATAHELDARVTASPAVVAPGGGIRVDGEGFTEGTSITIRFESRIERLDVDRTVVDPAGAFHRLIAIPDGLPPGAYGLVAVDGDGHEIVGALTLDPGAGPGVEVDRGAAWPLIVGLAAVVAGSVAVLAIGWRRRRST
jgi:hypothetical protein